MGRQMNCVSHLMVSFVAVVFLGAVHAYAQGIITTVAGNGFGGFSGDGGPGVSALLNIEHFTGGLAADVVGDVYIADTGNNRVRKIDPSGTISTVAGNGAPTFSGDGGPAISAALFAPTGVGLDSAGNLYIVDTGNQRIRRVGRDGIITTVAGNGLRGFSGDGGKATSASLSLGNIQYLGIAGYPTSVAVDGAGNLYIADTDNGRIRKVNPSGIITSDVTGLRDPYGVAADVAGNLFITDSSNDQMLKVATGGAVTTIAAGLSSPSGAALDRAGNLYIADSHSHRIRKVEPSGLASIVAGSGDPIFDPIEGYYFVGGFSGDGGPATSAQLNFPWGVAVDAAGNVYIADSLNNRIRKVAAASIGKQTTSTNATTIADGFSIESISMASPYPSDIAVSGLAGSVAKVTVTLNHVNFGSPTQADILLVGPQGQSVIIMSDAPGDGTGHIIDKTLTFDDEAASPLPSNNTLRSGTYKPTNFGSESDFFPPPAPAGPYGDTLSVFHGANPNGSWHLYEVDDTPDDPFDDFGPDVEITGGWSLTITTTTSTVNPIDDPQFFVRQHYLDFLNREPEADGLQDWMNVLNSCNGDATCLYGPNGKRTLVSQSFFGSEEFNLKGGYVFRFYKSSLARLPTYVEMEAGLQSVTGSTADEVMQKRAQFAANWVLRDDFLTAFPRSLTPTEFVDSIFVTAGITLTNRDQLISDLIVAGNTDAGRATALRAIVDSPEEQNKEFNSAFVYTQYVGYLRRDPEAKGYNDWLTYLNAHPEDFSTMVWGFVDSIEYRQRFGPP